MFNIFGKKKSETSGNIIDEDQWDKMIDFMTETVIKIDTTFREPIKNVEIKLKQKF